MLNIKLFNSLIGDTETRGHASLWKIGQWATHDALKDVQSGLSNRLLLVSNGLYIRCQMTSSWYKWLNKYSDSDCNIPVTIPLR